MNILGLVFPASLFQQADKKQSAESNVSSAKYSASPDVSRPLKSMKGKAVESVKPEPVPVGTGAGQKFSDDADGQSRLSSDLNIAANSALNSLNLDGPVQKNLRKKKKKKLKVNSKQFDNNTALKSVSFSDDADGQSRPSSDLNMAANTAVNSLNLDGPIRRNFRSKNKKKGKLNSFDDSPALTNISFSDSSAKEKTDGYRNDDKVNYTISTSEQPEFTEVIPLPAVITSATRFKSKVACLNDPVNLETETISRTPCPDDLDFIKNEIAPKHCDKRTDDSSEKTDGISFNTRRPNIIQKVVTAGSNDYLIEPKFEALSSSSCSLESTSYPNSNSSILTGEPDVAKGNISNEVIPSRLCSDAPTAGINNTVDQGKQFQGPVGAWRSPRCINSRKRIGKENTYLCWQRTMKNTAGTQASEKRLCHDNLSVNFASEDVHSLPGQNSSGQYGLLPPNYAGGDERQKLNLQKRDQNFQCSRHELVESPDSDFQRSYQGTCGQCASSSGKDVWEGKMALKRSKDQLTQSSRQHNVYHYKRGGYRLSKTIICNSSMRPIHLDKEDSQVPRTSDRICTDGQGDFNDNNHLAQPSGHQNLLHEVQSHAGTAISVTEGISSNDFHHIEDKNFTHLDTELPLGRNAEEHIISRLTSKRWVPLGGKISSTVRLNKDSAASGVRSMQAQQELVVQVESSLDGSKDLQQFDGLSNVKQWSCLVGSKSHYFPSSNQTKDISICIGSRIAAEVLDDAYRLQLASASILLATGTPIAEFEKILHSVSPMILPVHGPKYDKGSVENQPVPYLLQNPQELLRDVWSWYERPGNYGLGVMAEDSQNLKVGRTNLVPFQAFFVPLLSAVQLFGSSHHSLVTKSPGNLNTAMLEKEKSEETSSLGISRCKLDVEGMDSDCSLNSASLLPDNTEVVFEYFERQLPQQRKPFYEKIKELVEVGASDSLLFGDPSKLENTRSRDLHPASWFSVAWYPIYRIPEGTFRASFLTYHSLGHWVSRHIKPQPAEGDAISVASPALGMLSYNAQGECWFCNEKSAESLSIDGLAIDSSEILRERLRALEATAALFARGIVCKDQKIVRNRHPDYEFFMRRKQNFTV